jgi:hypothetical protein
MKFSVCPDPKGTEIQNVILSRHSVELKNRIIVNKMRYFKFELDLVFLFLVGKNKETSYLYKFYDIKFL